MNARSYLTDVPSIRCWRRDRRSESTFARGDDERAVTEEFLSNKPKTDRRKVDVRLRRGEPTVTLRANVNFTTIDIRLRRQKLDGYGRLIVSAGES